MTKAFAYYNEIDPFAAEWLRNLIREGLVAEIFDGACHEAIEAGDVEHV